MVLRLRHNHSSLLYSPRFVGLMVLQLRHNHSSLLYSPKFVGVMVLRLRQNHSSTLFTKVCWSNGSTISTQSLKLTQIIQSLWMAALRKLNYITRVNMSVEYNLSKKGKDDLFWDTNRNRLTQRNVIQATDCQGDTVASQRPIGWLNAIW